MSEKNLTLRPVRDLDLEFLFRLYASTREEELAVVAWAPEEKEAFLRQQFGAQHRYWKEHYGGASFDVVLVDGVPAGRLYVDRWEKEHRIVDISLLPAHRGGGIGTRLLRRVIDEAEAAGKAVSIHVEMYNPARRLYERLGFEPRGEHGVYVLMERPVAGEAASSAA